MHWPLNDTPEPPSKGERQMYEWMCRLVRDMAGRGAMVAPYYVDSDYSRAREIVDFLPKPVDPDKQAVRDILSIGGFVIPFGDDSMMWNDSGCGAGLALACLKRGREMQKEGK